MKNLILFGLLTLAVGFSIAQKTEYKEDLSFLNGYSIQSAEMPGTRQTVKNVLSKQAVYHNIDYCNNIKLLAYSRRDRGLEIRNINNAQIYCINVEKGVDRVVFSESGKFLAGLVTWDNTIIKNALHDLHMFDVNSKKWLWSISEKMTISKDWGNLCSVKFSPDNERVAILFEQKLFILNCQTAAVINEFDPSVFSKFKLPSKYLFMEDFLDVKFNSNNEIEFVAGTIYINFNVIKKILGLVIPYLNKEIKYINTVSRVKVDLNTGKSLSMKTINGFILPSYVTTNTFLRENFVISFFSNVKMLGLSDDKSKNPIFLQFPGTLSDIELDTNAKIMFYTVRYNSKVYRYDYLNNKPLEALCDHSSPASDIELVPGKKWIITSDINGMKNFWSYNGELLFRIYSDEYSDYMISTPQNYYQCSKGVLKDLRFMKGNNVYRFESFDLVLNRPDIILKKLETTDQALLSNFENAVKLRANKYNIDLNAKPDDFNLPVLKINNKKDLAISTSSQQVTLDLTAENKSGVIKEIIIFVNGVEFQRIVNSKKEKLFSTKVTVKLNSGNNFIEASCLDEKGKESLRESHETVCTANIVQKVYFLGLGVSNYKENEFNLKYAAKDIRDLVKYFKSIYGKNLIIDTLIDKNATVNNLQKSVLKLNKASENDLVIVSLNGHGLLDNNYNFYFGTYDVNFLEPSEKGLSYKEIEKLFSGIKSRNRLILIDACHSGELDKSEVGEKITQTSTPVSEVKFRGSEKLQSYNKKTGISTFQLMRDFFSDLSNQSGSHIISAAGGFEYAIESDSWNNGVFTYSVLNGLKNKSADFDGDGNVNVNELQRFVYSNVMNLTNGKQLPTARSSNSRNDFFIVKK